VKPRDGSAPHELRLGDDVRSRNTAPGEGGGCGDCRERRPNKRASFTGMTSHDPTDFAESEPERIPEPPAEDDAPDEVVAFCPVCAAREFRMSAKTAETYI
jgi:hypothetical protein